MPVQVRTTVQPSVPITVSNVEFADLKRQGLLYGSADFLYVTFLSYSDGPRQEVTQVKVRIQGPAPSSADVVALTSTGVEKIDRGQYRYPWGAVVTPGTYTVTWSALDVDNAAVTASDTVVVS